MSCFLAACFLEACTALLPKKNRWMLFFSFLVSTDVTNLFRQRFRKPCADENVASASSCLHISLPRAYALVGLGNLLPRPRCRGCFSILWEYYCVFLSFHDTSAKLSFRGASTPFRACSHTHVLTLLWLDEYYRRLTIKKTARRWIVCLCLSILYHHSLTPRRGFVNVITCSSMFNHKLRIQKYP